MTSKCFCVGCKSGYKNDIEWRKKNKERIPSLFSVPRNLDMLEKWRKAIPRTDKQLRFGSKVCDLHFAEDDFDEHFETKLADGTVWRLKKERRRLKKSAVPSIFPNLPEYASAIGKQIKSGGPLKIPVCSAVGCYNKLSPMFPRITFHSFPKNPTRRKLWVQAIGRKVWQPTKNSVVCSDHFSEEMMDKTSASNVRIRKDAVPITIKILEMPEPKKKIKENSDATSSKKSSTRKRKAKIDATPSKKSSTLGPDDSDSMMLAEQEIANVQGNEEAEEPLYSFAEPPAESSSPAESPDTRIQSESSIHISNNRTSEDSTNQSILSDSVSSETKNGKLVQSSKGNTTSNNHNSNSSNTTTLPTVFNFCAQIKSNKDLFEYFGEYVAGKMRKLDPNSCIHVQKVIFELFKNAEQGKYTTLSDAVFL